MPQMHEVDYEIFGDDMQYVEVELDPGEAAIAEAGGMMFMDDGIRDGDDLRRRVSSAKHGSDGHRSSAPGNGC